MLSATGETILEKSELLKLGVFVAERHSISPWFKPFEDIILPRPEK
jgi:hypothetical protein